MYLLSMFVKKDGLVRSKTKVFEEDDLLLDEFQLTAFKTLKQHELPSPKQRTQRTQPTPTQPKTNQTA